MIKRNMFTRKENSHVCTAAPGRLDWAAPEAQSLVLTSWLLCSSFYTWDTIEVAVSHSVNGVQQMFNHLEDCILWSPPSSDHELITNIKENRFEFMKIWKLQNTSYQKMYIFGQTGEESSWTSVLADTPCSTHWHPSVTTVQLGLQWTTSQGQQLVFQMVNFSNCYKVLKFSMEGRWGAKRSSLFICLLSD